MAVLKQHHLDLLRHLVAQRVPVPASELDGRNLRPLRTHDFVAEVGGRVVASEAGKRFLASADRQIPGPKAEVRPVTTLSEAQEETLRDLLRRTEPVPEDHLDGRVLRALEARGLVENRRGWVAPTEEGLQHFTKHVRRERTRRTRRATRTGAGSARAEILLRAVEQLEGVLPRDAEITIGDMPAYADDVLAGIRRLAREMDGRRS